MRDAAVLEPPGRLMGTYQCHIRGCLIVYPLTAGDYKLAA
jgi:hypothetical protein